MKRALDGDTLRRLTADNGYFSVEALPRRMTPANRLNPPSNARSAGENDPRIHHNRKCCDCFP